MYNIFGCLPLLLAITATTGMDCKTTASPNACFNAVDKEKSTHFYNYAPRNGTIYGIELDHLSGGVTCDYRRYRNTHWGCLYDSDALMVYMYKTDGTVLYPDMDGKTENVNFDTSNTDYGWYHMTTANIDSDSITFNQPQYAVTTDDQFMLQYSEAILADSSHDSTFDNNGTVCAIVYFLYVSCSISPTTIPTKTPTIYPTQTPTKYPTKGPTSNPTSYPVKSHHNPAEDMSTTHGLNVTIGNKPIKNGNKPIANGELVVFVMMAVSILMLCGGVGIYYHTLKHKKKPIDGDFYVQLIVMEVMEHDAQIGGTITKNGIAIETPQNNDYQTTMGRMETFTPTGNKYDSEDEIYRYSAPTEGGDSEMNIDVATDPIVQDTEGRSSDDFVVANDFETPE